MFSRPSPEVPDEDLERHPGAAVRGVGYLVRTSALRRDEYARQLAARLRRVSPGELSCLYGVLYAGDLSVSELHQLLAFPADDATELLGAAVLSRDGYVRQAALAHLRSLRHPRALAYALTRLGDWVEPVRREAEQLVFELLSAGQIEPFLASHAQLSALRRVGRVDLGPLLERVREQLRRPEFQTRVVARLADADAKERQFIYELLGHEAVASRELALRATKDTSSPIRRGLAERLAREPHAHPDLLLQLLNDRVPDVARAALRALALPLDPALSATVESLLFADSRGLRESARFVLERSGVGDFAERYREQLFATSARGAAAGCLAGLGETGDANDLALLIPWLDSPRAKLKAAALGAAVRLDVTAVHARLVDAASADQARVRSIAVAALQQRLDPQTVRELRERRAALGELARKSVSLLLASRSGWDAVPDLLDALADDSELVRDMARLRLDAWYAKHSRAGWMRPSEATRADLAKALARHASSPPKGEPPRSLSAVHTWAREVVA